MKKRILILLALITILSWNCSQPEELQPIPDDSGNKMGDVITSQSLYQSLIDPVVVKYMEEGGVNVDEILGKYSREELESINPLYTEPIESRAFFYIGCYPGIVRDEHGVRQCRCIDFMLIIAVCRWYYI